MGIEDICGRLLSRLVSSGVVCTEPHSRQQFLIPSTGLFEMIVGVLTTCHTQYT
jgi:hypothetical protein